MRCVLPALVVACLIATNTADARQPPVTLDTASLASGVAAELQYHYGKCFELSDVGHCRKAADLLVEVCEDGASVLCAAAARMYSDGAGVGPDKELAARLAKVGCDGGDASICAFTPRPGVLCTVGRMCDGKCIGKDDDCAADNPVVVAPPEPEPDPNAPKVLSEGAKADIDYHRRGCLDGDSASCRKVLEILDGLCEEGYEGQCPEATSLRALVPSAPSAEEIKKSNEAATTSGSGALGGSGGSGPNCVTGKRCGNSCISVTKKCHK